LPRQVVGTRGKGSEEEKVGGGGERLQPFSPAMEEQPGQLKRALLDAIAGAIADGISRTVTSPLDVIKIRFQVQLEPTTSWALLNRNVAAPSKYTGMLQASKDIF